MKITASVVIDVDPAAYRAEYGESTISLDEIRQRIRRDVAGAAEQAFVWHITDPEKGIEGWCRSVEGK